MPAAEHWEHPFLHRKQSQRIIPEISSMRDRGREADWFNAQLKRSGCSHPERARHYWLSDGQTTWGRLTLSKRQGVRSSTKTEDGGGSDRPAIRLN